MHSLLTKRTVRPPDGAPDVVVVGPGFAALHTQLDTVSVQDARIATGQSTQIYSRERDQTNASGPAA